MEIITLKKRLILFLLIFVTLLVMYGQVIGNTLLTSFGEEKVTMKFVTAFLFLLSSFSLLLKKKVFPVLIITTAVYVFTSWLFNDAKPLFLPIFESKQAIGSLKGDIPSWMTLTSFILFAISELINSKIIYRIIMIQACIAILGHLFQIPFLYYYVEDISTGEAVNTAILFLHLASYRLVDFKK